MRFSRGPLHYGLAAAVGLLCTVGGCSADAPDESLDPNHTHEETEQPETEEEGEEDEEDEEDGWYALGGATWYAGEDVQIGCQDVIATTAHSADEVSAWLAEAGFEGTSKQQEGWFGGPAPDYLDPSGVASAVDWEQQVIVMGVVHCGSAGKALSISGVSGDPSSLAVTFELYHPSVDGGTLSSYWTAVALSRALASGELVTSLDNVFGEELE